MFYLPFEDVGYLISLCLKEDLLRSPEDLWAMPRKLLLIHVSVGLVDLGLA